MAAMSDLPSSYLRQVQAERLPPPPARAGALGWLRANLFSTPGNAVLTVLCVAFIVWVVPPLVRFLLIDAVWSGTDREACLASAALPHPGACWAFVRVWFSYFVYGFYPLGQRWRVDIFFAALAFGIGWLAWLRRTAPRYWRHLFLRRVADFVIRFAARVSTRSGRRASRRICGAAFW